GAEARDLIQQKKQENSMHWIDPGSLPELAGTVERFVLNAQGEIDGFVMKDQAQAPILVHTPPHMGDELTRHVKASEKVDVRGVRPRGADLVAAVAVTARNGRRIVDRGPEHDRTRPKPKHDQPKPKPGHGVHA